MHTIRALAYLLVPMFVVFVLFYLYMVNYDPQGHRVEAEVARVAEQLELGLIDTATIAQESILDKAKDLLGLR